MLLSSHNSLPSGQAASQELEREENLRVYIQRLEMASSSSQPDKCVSTEGENTEALTSQFKTLECLFGVTRNIVCSLSHTVLRKTP